MLTFELFSLPYANCVQTKVNNSPHINSPLIALPSFSLTLSFSNVRLRVCSRKTAVGAAQESKLHPGTPSRSLSHACQIVTHCHRLAHPHLVQKTGLYLSELSTGLLSHHTFRRFFYFLSPYWIAIQWFNYWVLAFHVQTKGKASERSCEDILLSTLQH